jgi:multiple sugar transport system substrate-binding protein
LKQPSFSISQQNIQNIDDEVIELILRGKVPMVHSFSSHYIPDKYEGDTFKNFIGVAPVPRYKSILGGWALGIHRNAQHIVPCCNYLKRL